MASHIHPQCKWYDDNIINQTVLTLFLLIITTTKIGFLLDVVVSVFVVAIYYRLRFQNCQY